MNVTRPFVRHGALVHRILRLLALNIAYALHGVALVLAVRTELFVVYADLLIAAYIVWVLRQVGGSRRNA